MTFVEGSFVRDSKWRNIGSVVEVTRGRPVLLFFGGKGGESLNVEKCRLFEGLPLHSTQALGPVERRPRQDAARRLMEIDLKKNPNAVRLSYELVDRLNL